MAGCYYRAQFSYSSVSSVNSESILQIFFCEKNNSLMFLFKKRFKWQWHGHSWLLSTIREIIGTLVSFSLY